MKPLISLSLDDWHRRYLHQARWTESLRQIVLTKLPPQADILEVGCGTGAVLSSVTQSLPYPSRAYGLDKNYPSLQYANHLIGSTRLTAGDAIRLPFAKERFDLVYCHFLLLWLAEPRQAIREMSRVTKPGGLVVSFAEPDYDHRIDHPPPLDELGKLQTDSLRTQGADAGIGRSVADICSSAGLCILETGIFGGQWHPQETIATHEDEWAVLEHDLPQRVSPQQLAQYRQISRIAEENGSRVLFVPTFYTITRKK